jgi:hypothetical protein
MPTTKEQISSALNKLVSEPARLIELTRDSEQALEFGFHYQRWYSQALKIVEALAPDRLQEFRSYYEIDPKRKITDAENYVIQDYIKGVGAPMGPREQPRWDIHNLAAIRGMNQGQILASLSARIDSVLSDVTGYLFSQIQDAELDAARGLLNSNVRAAGAVAGVVLERHLQRLACKTTPIWSGPFFYQLACSRGCPLRTAPGCELRHPTGTLPGDQSIGPQGS